MTVKDPALKARKSALIWRERELNTIRQKLQEEGEFKIAMIQKFFREWEGYLNDHGVTPETNLEGYRKGVDSLPKDDPSTSMNEAISEDQLLKAIEKIMGKPLQEVGEFDVAKIQGDLNMLKQKMKEEYAKKSSIENEHEDTKRQIKDIDAILTANDDPYAY